MLARELKVPLVVVLEPFGNEFRKKVVLPVSISISLFIMSAAFCSPGYGPSIRPNVKN